MSDGWITVLGADTTGQVKRLTISVDDRTVRPGIYTVFGAGVPRFWGGSAESGSAGRTASRTVPCTPEGVTPGPAR